MAGDFVTRRLPAELLQPWDRWLSESLSASRAQLGEHWLEVYLTSPFWRFVLTPGVAGQGAWAGVLMPSVDRVGRYYPLTLACPLARRVDPWRVLTDGDWFARAESTLAAALDGSCSVEGFDALVLALDPPAAARVAPAETPDTALARATAWRLEMASPQALAAVYPDLLHRALQQVFCAYSLWWTRGSARVAPSCLVCQGLPPSDGFSALIDGDWSGEAWWGLDPGTLGTLVTEGR
ncbi:MAG: type VI secretion system-associated protein TagF [Sphingobacteriia bacterium]|nr:type VI secretion system-associated protein TagF [Sphingobacteriia bacterium]NCC38923.1 type VI secretion system-associated protein TagF [Gammaproteobacteria bacterium]